MVAQLANIAFGLLIIAFLLAFARLVRGPSLPDRVVALDLMATLAVGFIATYALATGESLYVDLAVVLALVAFLGTVAYGHYIEKGGRSWRRT